MNQQLTKEQERIQSLQERSFFEQLSKDDKAFVLHVSSQELFDEVHRSLIESKNLYDIPAPRALKSPIITSSANRFQSIILPISSAAAAAIITFFFFKKETIIYQNKLTPTYLAADTVYIPQIKHDTLVKEVHAKGKTIYVNKSIITEVIALSASSPSSEVLPPISNVDLINRGYSASTDNTIALLEGGGF